MKTLRSRRRFPAPPFQGSFHSIPCSQGSRPGLCCASPSGFCSRDPWDFHGRARHSPARAEQHSPGRKPISAKIIFLRPNICCMDPIFLGFSGSVRSPKSPYPAQIDLNFRTPDMVTLISVRFFPGRPSVWRDFARIEVHARKKADSFRCAPMSGKLPKFPEFQGARQEF